MAYKATHPSGTIDPELEKLVTEANDSKTAGKINWQNLLKILETYGPQVYALLAALFGWPPIPFPVPTPTPAPTP
jgi:hypothetical protein